MSDKGNLVIGFTGSRYGMSDAQKEQLRSCLYEASEFHHGDCLGADAEAHYIAKDLGVPIILHPPISPTLRAFCQGATVELPPKDYLVRNHDIVDSCDLLLAAPKSAREEMRSGTWATVRYARRTHSPYDILRPEQEEN